MNMQRKWYKDNPQDNIWWLDNGDEVEGEHIFSFDKITEYNLFTDFPYKLNPNQVEIFIKEQPFWAVFFADRLEEYYSDR
jgi:hypothetical protein